MIKDIKLKSFLSHPLNKQKICKLIVDKSIEMMEAKRKRFVVGYGAKILSNVPNWLHHIHDHDEADTLLICLLRELYVMYMPVHNPIITVISPDTDVLMLTLHYSAESQATDIFF